MKNKIDALRKCENWYKSYAGENTLQKLDTLCGEIMSEIFGYYAIETGVLSGKHDLLKNSRIAAGFSLGELPNANNASDYTASDQANESDTNYSVYCSTDQLPISTDNIDLVVASHIFETSDEPHQILREIDRILVPEGHCILIGFNPFAIGQTASHFRSGFKREKQLYKMRSVNRIRDWFSLLGFEVLDVNYLGCRPKIRSKKIFDSLGWLERWSSFAGPVLGNIYMVHAKKQVIAMRPDNKVWKAPAVLNGGKVALNRTAQKIRRDNYSNS